MKIKIRPGLMAVLLALWLTWAPGAGAAEKILFQTSTLQALMNGVYDGDYTCGELSRHGNLGLGTFQALDGEMVVVDGKCYQVKADGQAYQVSSGEKTPFAEVTFFKADRSLDLGEIRDLQQLEGVLARQMDSPNFPYAFKIYGKFSYIKTRSVPRQAKPYPPLMEAVKRQAVFEFRDVEGVMVGFYHPRYLAGTNLAGFHVHFLTANRQAGGHLLNCRIARARVEVARLTQVQLRLPGTAEFAGTDLSGDKRQEAEKVEK